MNRKEAIELFNELIDKQVAVFDITHVYTSIRFFIHEGKIKSKPYGKGFKRISGQQIVVEIPKSFWENGYNDRLYRKYLGKFGHGLSKFGLYDREKPWDVRDQVKLF